MGQPPWNLHYLEISSDEDPLPPREAARDSESGHAAESAKGRRDLKRKGGTRQAMPRFEGSCVYRTPCKIFDEHGPLMSIDPPNPRSSLQKRAEPQRNW